MPRESAEFDEALLKPDVEDYDFDDYFSIQWETGMLIPDPLASVENQHRARKTIELDRLNANGKPQDRVDELEKFEDSNNPVLDKCAYRFFYPTGCVRTPNNGTSITNSTPKPGLLLHTILPQAFALPDYKQCACPTLCHRWHERWY
jgi:hypothetical protein